MNKSHTTDKKSSLNDLIDIVRHLRDPQKGCEWDIKQTAKSLNTHIIEEAYELVEAIDAENVENIKDELGDLLLQIIFQCQIANEKNKSPISSFFFWLFSTCKASLTSHVSSCIFIKTSSTFEKSRPRVLAIFCNLTA